MTPADVDALVATTEREALLLVEAELVGRGHRMTERERALVAAGADAGAGALLDALAQRGLLVEP